jgi:hypothetical protein
MMRATTRAPWIFSFVSLVLFLAIFTANLRATDRSLIKYVDSVDQISSSRLVLYDLQHKQLFIAKGSLNRVDVYSTNGYALIGSIPVGNPLSLDLSPDATTIAVTNGTSYVSLYNSQTFKLVRRVLCVSGSNGIDNNSAVTNFLFTSDGNAVIQIDDTQSFLNLTTGSLDTIATFGTNTRMTRSGNGSKIVIGKLHVYDVATRQLTMESGVPDTSAIQLVANQDGTKFAMCAATSGTMHVVLLDQNLNVVADTPGKCDDLVFSRDNSRLYTSFEQVYVYSGVGVYDGSTLALLHNATAFGQNGEYSILETDETGLLFRVWDKSLFVIDTTVAGSDGTDLYWPYVGPGQTSTGLDTSPAIFIINEFDATASVTFDQDPAPILQVVRNKPGVMDGLIVAAPASNITKVASIYAQQAGFRFGYPSSFSYGTQLVRMITNAGSTTGGEYAEIEAIGAGPDPTQVHVRIGGAHATTVAILNYAEGAKPLSAPFERIIVKTPPGIAGWADVDIVTTNGSDTLKHAFQYVNDAQTISIQGNLKYILYDPFRDRVYVSNQGQVEVIDPAAKQLLAPLLPPGGKLAGSSFAGLAMSPDGSRLYVADTGTNKVFAIDPDHSGTGESIDFAALVGTSASPIQVAATSTRKLLVLMSSSTAANNVYEYDLDAGTATLAQSAEGTLTGNISSSRDGSLVVASETLKYRSEPALALLDYSRGIWHSVRQPNAGTPGTLSADGNASIVGGSQAGYLLDSTLHSSRLINGNFDTRFDYLTLVPGETLNTSGSVVLLPYTKTYDGASTTGLVRVLDVNRGQMLGTVVFPEGFLSSIDSLSNRYFAVDDTGRRLFGITTSGVSIVELYEPPLTIGHVEPPFGPPAGGNTVTVRGTDFKPGATVTFGSSPAATTFINENTLAAVVPAMPLGTYDVTVTNPDSSYTAPGLYAVTAARAAPVLSSLDPTSALVLGDTLPLTVHGQNFYSDSVVLYNNIARTTRFIDTATLQINVSNTDLLKTGAVPVAVYSPSGGGTSATLSFTVTNPTPSITQLNPSEIVTGTLGTTLTIAGSGLSPDSVVQWNGTNLVSSFNVYYPQQINATVPASLLSADATVSVTVSNPAPGGGVSNALTVNVGPPTPVLQYPASIDFGSVVVSAQTGNPFTLRNTGTADLHITSITASPSDFKVNGCLTTLSPGYVCTLNAGFAPSIAGTQTGTITIADDGRGNPHIIAVTGTGVSPALPSVSLDTPDTTTTGATVKAAVDTHGVSGQVWADWGTTNALGNSTAKTDLLTQSGNQYVQLPISGLAAGTTYSYQVSVTTIAGTSHSAIATFTTVAIPPAFDIGIPSGGSTATTINAGDTASYSLSITGANGYTGTATLTCTGAPQYSTCSVPSSVSIGAQATAFSVSVRTTKPGATTPASGFIARWKIFGLTVPAFLFVFCFAQRRTRRSSLLALLLLALASLSSCGGSGGGTVTPPPAPGTPSGTYTLVVSAVSGNVTKTTNLTLTVR